MKVFISYAREDKDVAQLIAERLRQDKHEVWFDGWKLKPGDNLVEKINEGLKGSDALIVVVSRFSLESKWSMYEYSAMAFGELSGKGSRIIPVLVDKSTVPEYLARYVYVDISDNVTSGVNAVAYVLTKPQSVQDRTDRKRSHEKAIVSLAHALHAGRFSLVCGAGVSIGAGVPSWNQLLLRLLGSMMDRISKNHSMPLKDVDPLEFQRRYGPSSLVVGKYLKSNLGNDFMPLLRDVLYCKKPTSCDIIDAISELARPQRYRKPLDSILTFNFDGLIEEALSKNSISHKAIYEEGMRNGPNELPVYHVHGYLPRTGKIQSDADIVFSEDAYHSRFIDPFSWSNLTQLNKLSQNTCLFIGLSLSDPNMRRLLDVAYRKNPSRQRNHYIVKRVPSFSGKNDTVDDLALLLEEQDANELGLNVVWIEEFGEIAPMLRRIAEVQA